MRIISCSIFILCGTLSSCINPKGNTDTIVPVNEEPMHNLVFEKGVVKILDVQIMGNDTTLFHKHSNPIFYVSLGWQRVSEQKFNEGWGNISAGWSRGKVASDTTYASRPKVHRLTNNGSTTSRLIGILNCGIGIESKYNSKGYEVANQWFRSNRIVLNEGESFKSKKSEFPMILVVVSGSKFRLIHNGQTESYDKEWFYIEQMYELINNGDTPLEIIEIEILN